MCSPHLKQKTFLSHYLKGAFCCPVPVDQSSFNLNRPALASQKKEEKDIYKDIYKAIKLLLVLRVENVILNNKLVVNYEQFINKKT